MCKSIQIDNFMISLIDMWNINISSTVPMEVFADVVELILFDEKLQSKFYNGKPVKWHSLEELKGQSKTNVR